MNQAIVSMDRRSFLLGTGTLTLGQLLAGCGGQNQAALSVQLLKGSIPAQVVNEFRNALKPPTELKFTPVEQLKVLFAQLQSWQQPTTKADNGLWLPNIPFINPNRIAIDLVTLGDYWLGKAIEQKLIQPINPAQLQQWQQLPNKWQELVRRNVRGYLDPQGEVWGAPYRWGSTVIIYNRDKFKSLGWTPNDWSDLWREELRDRISLLDQPREVIGLTLKKLGWSYNTLDLNKVPNLEKQLSELHQQVKLYSSDTYLQPLILGDTWLAVGWSTDVLRVMQRYPQIAAVVPQSGTALWADLWVSPVAKVATSALSHQWIDFCWQERARVQISLLSKGSSPIPVTLNPDDIQTGLRSILLSDPQVFQRSEFLLPLPKEALQQYQSLWQAIRLSRA